VSASAKRHPLQPRWDGRGSLVDRFEEIRRYVEGRSVLDIGAVSRHGRDDWVHGLIAGVATRTVGVDVDEPAVEQLRAQGYDIRLEDARSFDVGEQFDVVFAGEVIEHLDDVHGFLTSARRHVGPDGRLVLTTPNVFYAMNFVYRIGGHARVHREHTCWYCADTITHVLERNGFRVEEIRYIRHRSPTPWRRALSATVLRLLPTELRHNTLVVVASPTG